jgi:ketosteroid isomerase-like protein
MSRENVQIMRQVYEAANRDDVDSAVADFAPDCEYMPSGKFPTDEVYRGPKGFKKFITWLTDAFDDVHLDTHELIASDDKVFVHQTNSGRGKMSGAEATRELWLVWTLREGKIGPRSGVHDQGGGPRSRQTFGVGDAQENVHLNASARESPAWARASAQRPR